MGIAEQETTRDDVQPPRRYRLRRAHAATTPIIASVEQRAVIEHDRGRLKVLAGPGTGKTATMVEAVADRILRRGVDPSSMLVLTFSRAAAAELSERIAARLDITSSEPLVRTLHGYAYALLRTAAAAAGKLPPTLLPAGQADMVVREILQGHADAPERYWPKDLHPALKIPAFASELREFMLRAAELQIAPRRIARLGERYGRPEWVAVAQFVEEYRDIADLRQGTTRRGAKLDQAELMVSALECLQDPIVLAGQQARVRRLFVDEYQDVDPAQAELIGALAAGADELIVVGDPDQSIYAFRGAAAGAMDRIAVDGTLNLTVSRRLPPILIDATRRIAENIPGARSHRALRAVATSGADRMAIDAAHLPALQVRVFSTPGQEAAFVADQIRRAHLDAKVPWRRMAILLRAPDSGADRLRRALSAVGVPVTQRVRGALVDEPLVAALLSVLRIGVEPARLSGPVAIELLLSPLGRMDVLAVRRLRRMVRLAGIAPGAADPVVGAVPTAEAATESSAETIARILSGRLPVPANLTSDLARPLHNLAHLIGIASRGSREPTAEQVLWQVWDASGLAGELVAASEGGGYDAVRADAQLDAALDLFDRAAQLAEELPFPGVAGLLGMLSDEQLAPHGRSEEPVDAVTIMSAHSSKGLEWDVVAIAGVQEGTWPDVRPRHGLLRYGEFADAAAGISVVLPQAGQLADERRLFYVAATRARHTLLVTAVESADSAPSRFLPEIAGEAGVEPGWPTMRSGRPRRALNLSSLVADLRGVVISGGDSGRRERAVRVLAALASAGVRGAAPQDWYGLAASASDAALVADGGPIVLSPSQIESVRECPLRTVLERHGARPELGQPQLLGIAVHALAQGMATGASPQDIDLAMNEFLAAQRELAPWELARLRRQLIKMREALVTWMEGAGSARTLLGSELSVDVTIAPSDGDAGRPHRREIRLLGRIDWLALDTDGRVVVTDFKTGSTKISAADAEVNPQLATYQLALALGALAELTGGELPKLGGAELVYVAAGKPELRTQSAQTGEIREGWLDSLRDVADEVVGPSFLARAGSYCQRCPVRKCCPVQPEGRQVTR